MNAPLTETAKRRAAFALAAEFRAEGHDDAAYRLEQAFADDAQEEDAHDDDDD